MIKKINTITGRLSTKLALVLFFALGCAYHAFAGNTLTIGDNNEFTIASGGETVVNVNLNNENVMTGLEFRFQLPDGLNENFNPEVDWVRTGRTKGNSHDIRIVRSGTTTDTYLVTILPLTGTVNFKSVEEKGAAILQLKLKASKDFKKSAKINVTKILGSAFPEKIGGEALSYEMDDFTVTAFPLVASMTTGTPALKMVPDGKKACSVDILMNNEIDVNGIQADIVLPTGMKIVTDEDGVMEFNRTDRVPGSFNFSTGVLSDGRIRLIVESMSGAKIVQGDGKIFSFNVVADETLAEKSVVKVQNMMVANQESNFKLQGEVLTVDVTNAKITELDPLMAKVTPLDEAFAKAMAEVAEKAANVKDSANIVAAQKAVAQQIADLKAAIDASYQNGTLDKDSANYLKTVADIQVAIDKYVADAVAAQKAYEENLAQDAKKKANEEAYKKLAQQVKAVQEKFDAAQADVKENCKDVVEQMTPKAESIQKEITVINDSVEKAYKAVELTAETSFDFETIAKAIEAYVVEAKDAQKAFEADAAKKAANEAAYKVLKAKLDDVKALLSNVKANIKLNCKDVAAAFEETVNAIESQFAAMADSLELMYKKVELTAETPFDLAKLEADIVKLDTDSKAAQAKWTANETAQETVNTVLMRVMDALNEADATISEQCPNVGTAYLDKLAEVATQVNQIGMEVSEKYSAVELTAEAADAYVQVLNKLAERIQAIVDEAVKAEQGTTGIRAVMGGNAQGVKIYTLAGQAVAAPVKGQVNVFKFADGTVKKMYVR